ncbi:nadph oxidase [Anaeramoeba flamelloides]|uniref:Nadph oxidase n=1 Tax=Anaeramoeba flamelloides TaxID=1746091 RepID=A0AAV7YJ72_9EUKA|nr:nadph oxidase [Anaeramoeba flamelloides]
MDFSNGEQTINGGNSELGSDLTSRDYSSFRETDSEYNFEGNKTNEVSVNESYKHEAYEMKPLVSKNKSVFPNRKQLSYRLFHLQFFIRSPFRSVMLSISDLIIFFLLLALYGGLSYYYYGKAKSYFLAGFWMILSFITANLTLYSTLIIFLTSSHHSILFRIFSSAWDKNLWVHKFNGWFTFCCSLIHFIACVLNWSVSKKGFGGFKSVNNIIGLVCLVALCALQLLPLIRKFNYELFYYSHVFSMIIYIVGLFFHHQKKAVLKVTIAGLALYVFDVIYRLWSIFRYKSKIIASNSQNSSMCVLTIKKYNFSFQPGQWIKICIPSVSRWQFHPISICSKPNLISKNKITNHRDVFKVLIKDLGDWSKKVLQKVGDQSIGSKIYVEAPVGTFLYPVANYNYIILFGGGVGIAPMISLLEALYEEKENFPRIVKFFWILRNPEALSIFGQKLAKINKHPRFFISCFVSTEETEIKNISHYNDNFIVLDRPRVRTLCDGCRKDALELKIPKILVSGCGPKKLSFEFHQTCLDLSDKKVKFHFEKKITNF